MKLQGLDLAIVATFLAIVVGYGCWFARRRPDAERFMSAGRSLPAWVLGLSIFGSYVSSISFLANPGKAFGENWNAYVFSLMTPIAAWIAIAWFLPFYRRSGELSAYHHLEHRFGPWARTYAVLCFMLVQCARMGVVLYLLAIALGPLLGIASDDAYGIGAIILVTGLLTTLYSLLGGMEAVVWTGVLQSLMLVLSAAICFFSALFAAPDGPIGVIKTGIAADKFSLGSLEFTIATQTFWGVVARGLVINLQNFGIDQSYVQRYQTAASHQAAARSVWLGAWLYVPVAAMFFTVGTALFAFYQAHPDRLPGATNAAGASATAKTANDAVLPGYIVNELPTGMAGIVVAGVFAAGMDSPLASLATLFLQDIYRRYLRRRATPRESLIVLRIATIAWGILGVAVGLAMIGARTILDSWWQLEGILGGGMLGLFLLGLAARRVSSKAAALGVACGVGAIIWMTFSRRLVAAIGAPGALASPFHADWIPVIGTGVIVLVGLLPTGVSAAYGMILSRSSPTVD